MKTDFGRLRYLISRRPAAQLRVARAWSKSTRTTASLSGMPGGRQGAGQVADGAVLLAEAKAALHGIDTEIDTLRGKLRPLIDALSDPLARTVLSMRYMDGYSVRLIAIRLSYSERHIFRVIVRAEEKVMEAQHGQTD